MLQKAADWLEERTGYRALLSAALDEPIPGGARVAYVFGSTLVFVLGLQLVTGVLLAAFYSPSVSAAWASVAYLQTQLRLGWFIRGLHSTGASAMMILVIAHLLQVTLWGAYRKPREVNWWIGLAMMGCLLAFALTGYLLPWDQKGYWATQVATSLLGATPVLGPSLKVLLQGGPIYGNLTLTHFFTLHVLLLPATLILLLVVHIALFRRHGVTPGWQKSLGPTEPFWPHQLFYDLLAMAVVFGWIVAIVLRGHGVPLEAPADPASSYDARPEWYFLPLYQLLKLFPGRLEVIAALGAPLVVGGLLFALPLLDRGPTRAPAARKRYVGAVTLVVLGAVALGGQATFEDRHNLAFKRGRERAENAAAHALALATLGVPPTGGTAVWDNDPLRHGRRIFSERCAGCHQLGGTGEAKGPDLDGWSSRGWIAAFLKDPESPRFYGRTKIRGMKPVTVAGVDFDALVEWLYSQAGGVDVDAVKVARGQAVFTSSGCDDCHEIDGQKGGDGAPNLGGRASKSWIQAFLLAPDGERFFDRKNEMPVFHGKLSPEDLDALATLLAVERQR
jgi:ubiquinol-cytochrome c reductase cytochrome b subunit